MAASTHGDLPQVAKDLQNAHDKQSMSHVFQEFSDLSKNPGEYKKALQAMNGHVQLPKELGLDGFHIAGFDAKNNTMFLDGPKNQHVALKADGTEYKGSDAPHQPKDGKHHVVRFDTSHPVASNLPDHAGAAPAPGPAESTAATGGPQKVGFGSHGREMEVNGDKATYKTQHNDNLWNIAKDLLNKDGHAPTNNEIGNMVNKIAKDNHIANPNHLSENKTLTVPAPEKNTTTPPERQGEQTPASQAHPMELDQAGNKLKKSDDGKFNPLAPQGLGEGEHPFGQLDQKTDGVRNRTATDSTDADGQKVRTYGGALADGWVNDTKFSGQDKFDANGRLISRHLEYTTNGHGETPAMDFQNGGQGLHIKHIKSVDTSWDQKTGTYTTKITDSKGRSHNIISDADGKPLRQEEPQPPAPQ